MARTKVYRNVPKVDIYRPNLEEFFRFMYERHMIYVRRFQHRLPPPWTENPILREYKFTNVYRELDRGTIWYKENVLPRIALEKNSLRETIWLTTMYRLLNRIETFEKVSLIASNCWEASRRNWQAHLERLSRTTPIFTNAHLTLPSRYGQTKLQKYISVLNFLYRNLDKITKEVREAKGLEEIFWTLRQVPCVGAFISYEICCDLMLAKAIPYSENDWVNPGPGCKTGLRLIFPKTTSEEGFQDRIKYLQANQEKIFKELKLDFPYLYPNQTMTLRSIEHSLCEYGKYKKASTGIGRMRMHFIPTTGINNGQGVLRFPR